MSAFATATSSVACSSGSLRAAFSGRSRTRVSSRAPPHRTVLAAFPHTALLTRFTFVTARALLCLCLAHVVTSMSPRLDSQWGGSFPLSGREFHPLEAAHRAECNPPPAPIPFYAMRWSSGGWHEPAARAEVWGRWSIAGLLRTAAVTAVGRASTLKSEHTNRRRNHAGGNPQLTRTSFCSDRSS